VLHQEADGIAAFAASETFVDLLGRRDGKRRGLFVMKGAEAQVVDPPFFQFYKFPYDFNDVNAGEDLLYGLLTYQLIFNELSM